MFRSSTKGSFDRTTNRAILERAAVTTGRMGSAQKRSAERDAVWPERGSSTWIKLEILFTKTSCAMFPSFLAVFAGRKRRSSLHNGQISTRLVYLKFEMLDLSSVLMSFLEALTCDERDLI
jgi:hypothetical protein